MFVRLHVNRRESCITWQGLKGWFTQITHLPNLPLKLLLHNFYSGVEVVFLFFCFFPGTFTQHSPDTMLWTIFQRAYFFRKKSQTNRLTARTLDALVTWKYTMLLSSVLWRAQHRQIKISHNLIMCPSGNYSVMLNMCEMSLFIYCFNIEIPVR